MPNYNDSAGVRKRRIAMVVAISTTIAASAEGLRQWAYDDIANPALLTVCYGHTGEVDRQKFYSIAECEALLSADMLEAVEHVEKCVPGLPAPVLAAFSDAVFNIGPKVACDKGNSTAARLLAAGDYQGACDQLVRWDKARVAGVMVSLPGLTKRRAKERDLCLQGVV